MTNLQVINLDCHSLFEFPDLTDMLSSLLNLFTEENPYTKIKMSIILKKLRCFTIGGSRLHEFPDLSDVSSSLEEFRIPRSNMISLDYIRENVEIKSPRE
jgi:Leucine-rich repeat (LRR) protein